MKAAMTRLPRGNRELIRAMNRNLVLNTVRRQGPLSRTQLTERTRLSVGAISEITGELLHENWIAEVGESESTGGRRQVLLHLQPAAGYVVGLKLMEDRAVCAVTDLEARVLGYRERKLADDLSPQAVSRVLAEAVESGVRAAGIPREKVFGVGIGLAGVIDHHAGVVHYSPFLHWEDVPLAHLLAERLRLPVYLENDVNTLTITEQLYGPGHDVADFVVVTVGRGIGMGMVLNHQLYQGAHGGVGELGHITLEADGPCCACGKRGCLEALAADEAVLRAIERARADGAETALGPGATLADAIAAADAGDAAARAAFARSGEYLGRGLAVIVNLLSPALIIVSGEGVAAGAHRLAPMLESMRAHAFHGLLDGVQVMVKPTDDETWARGAAGLVVGKLFESPLLKAPDGATAS